MATSDSREVTIEATPEEILDVIADVESTPTWSPQYQSAEVLEAYDNGRPKRVKMKIKTAGISDEQIVEYTWAGRRRQLDPDQCGSVEGPGCVLHPDGRR